MKKTNRNRGMTFSSVICIFICCIVLTSIICIKYSYYDFRNQCEDIVSWMIEKVILNDEYPTNEKKIFKISESISQKESDFSEDSLFIGLPKKHLLNEKEFFYAYKIAIFDKNGNVMIESGNDINLGDVYCICLDSYMNAKSYTELKKYQKKMNNGDLVCYSLGYHNEDGQIIPDVLYFYDTEQSITSKEDATPIYISENQPEKYFTVGENLISMDLFFRDDNYFLLKSKYKELDGYIRSKDIMEDAKWLTSDKGSSCQVNFYPTKYEVFYKTIINKVPCTVVILIDHSPILDILKSNIFRLFIFMEVVICCSLLIIIWLSHNFHCTGEQ